MGCLEAELSFKSSSDSEPEEESQKQEENKKEEIEDENLQNPIISATRLRSEEDLISKHEKLQLSRKGQFFCHDYRENENQDELQAQERYNRGNPK